MDMNAIQKMFMDWLLSSGLNVVMVVILAIAALKMKRVVARRLFAAITRRKEDPEFHKRVQTLGAVVRYVLTGVIILVASMIVLDEIGIEIGPLLAAAGIVGLAVGFGAQSLVKDVISGFFILFEDQIRVGDVVQIADKSGLVEKMNLKTTMLRDLAGNVHYVPNGEIGAVTNMTKDFSRYVFDIGVAYRENVDEVIDVMRAVDEELRSEPAYRDDILEPLEVLGLDQFADSAVVIRARTTTKPLQQWRIGREFNRRLKKKFDEKNIEIPFPHVTVYMGKDKSGAAPPLRVVREDQGDHHDLP